MATLVIGGSVGGSASVTVSPEGIKADLGLVSAQFSVNGNDYSVTLPSSLPGSQAASNGGLLSSISADGNPLTAIQGALSSLAGAGAAPSTTQANQSIGSVSLVEDVTKTLFVSFKNGL